MKWRIARLMKSVRVWQRQKVVSKSWLRVQIMPQICHKAVVNLTCNRSTNGEYYWGSGIKDQRSMTKIENCIPTLLSGSPCWRGRTRRSSLFRSPPLLSQTWTRRLFLKSFIFSFFFKFSYFALNQIWTRRVFLKVFSELCVHWSNGFYPSALWIWRSLTHQIFIDVRVQIKMTTIGKSDESFSRTNGCIMQWYWPWFAKSFGTCRFVLWGNFWETASPFFSFTPATLWLECRSDVQFLFKVFCINNNERDHWLIYWNLIIS